MIQQGFGIGDGDWYVMGYYDIKTEKDLKDVEIALLSVGCPIDLAQEAVENLRKPNAGFTFSSARDRISIIFVSKTTSAEQAYDTVQHELKHAVEHIGEAFHVRPDSEESAYLQGEIARNMFKAAALLFCPICNGNKMEHYE